MSIQTAMIQSAAAQRRHFDAARLDTAPESTRVDTHLVAARRTRAGARSHRVRRSLAALLFRAGRAVAPRSSGAGRPAAI